MSRQLNKRIPDYLDSSKNLKFPADFISADSTTAYQRRRSAQKA